MAALADAEGFRFVRRLVDDLALDRVAIDAPCEFFVALVEDELLLAVAGVTPDPYVDDASIGRLRHVYVRPDVRGKHIGRALIRYLEGRAQGCYTSLRLRTDTQAASQFYERLGYAPLDSKSATHQRQLAHSLRAPAT
jgi:GNAT superfamily N-acetyltransferase